MNNCAMLDIEYSKSIQEPKRSTEMIDFTIEDLTSISPIPNPGLLGIVERICYKPRNDMPYMLFFCEAEKRYNGGCPFCGSLGYHVHGKLRDDKLIHDVPRGVIQVDIRLELKRYRCNDCGANFSHPYEEIVEGKQMTKRLYDLIRRESFRRPFADVAKDYGYSPTTIANIFDEYSAELEAYRPHILAPRVLGIDEKQIVHAMRGVFVDIETGQLLEMTADNKRSDILGTIERMKDYDKNIQIVTMDMANGYRSYIYEALPNAQIMVDKFHVIHKAFERGIS